MNICICGGGGIGTVCASVFSYQGHNVNLLTGHPESWQNKIYAIEEDGKILNGYINKISSRPQDVIPSSDIILLCVPGFLIEKTLREIKPYLSKLSIIGSVVSSTGFFFTAHKIFESPLTLFGFQRVPYIARVKEYGKSGYLLGHKESLNIAIENSNDPYYLMSILQNLFKTKINLLNSYLEASLTNSNPLLHTARLYTMWKDKEYKSFDIQSFFYKEWTNEASELLLQMDKEFMTLISKLNLTQGSIKSILEHYEVSDAKSLTTKISSIPAFISIKSPMKEVNGKWFPDLKSRYFTEDFAYGLSWLIKLYQEMNIKADTSFTVYQWGMRLLTSIDNFCV